MRTRSGSGDLAPLPHARREPGQGAVEAGGPYRIQPLHLHIVLVVEVHVDGNCLDPGIICVAGIIKVPLVYLCMVKECHISRALTTSLRAPRGPRGGEASLHSSSAPLETSALFPLQLEP